jgi:capsular polysaccharide biosynthesis protein
MSKVGSNRFGVLRRRGWVVIVTLLVTVGAAYLYAHHKPPSYTASAYVLVSSGASPVGPGSANEASSLATTYSGLIPKDSAIIAAVSTQLGASPADVRAAIKVYTTNSTALLEIRYTAGSKREAIAGATAVATDIVGSNPSSQAIPAGAILPVSVPRSASESSTTRNIAVPIGAILGLLLGAIVLMAWERFDPRVDTIDDLADLLDTPVTGDDFLTADRIYAVRHRWRELALPEWGPSGGPPTRAVKVALVGVGRSSADVADSLVEAIQAGRGPVGGADPAELALRSFGDPRYEESGRLMGSDPDLVVLVVRYGEHGNDVIKATQVLKAFGLKPAWGIIAAKRRSPSRQRIPQPEAPLETGSEKPTPSQDAAAAPPRQSGRPAPANGPVKASNGKTAPDNERRPVASDATEPGAKQTVRRGSSRQSSRPNGR